MDWIRLPGWNRTGISIVWKALLTLLPLIWSHLTWRINDGSRARIGMDPWTGGGRRCYLPRELVQILEQQNIKVIAHIADQDNTSIFILAWKIAAQLNLPLEWHQIWEDYTIALSESHIRIKEGPDEVMWDKADHSFYTPKEGYLVLIGNKKPEVMQFWWTII